MIFRRFPYTTLNDLNLDWIIKQVKQIAAALQGKQDKPDAAGTAGQVLGLDENLVPVWLDQSGGGTTNYNNLLNKPQINSVTLSGNKTAEDLGLANASDIPGYSIQLPVMDGEASAGTNHSRYAMEGHVHPTDTSRASNTIIGIVQNSNTATQSISRGQYVIWQGALYTASTAIASGATLSSANLTAVPDGGLNALKPLNATSWDELYNKFSNSQINQLFLVFLVGGVTNTLTEGRINFSAKGYASKTDSQTLDAVLMTGLGGLCVGRFTISSSGSVVQSLKEATLTSV